VGARQFVTPEQYSAEQRQFFRTGVEFARTEVVQKRERFADHDYQVLRDLIAKAGELGLLGVDVGEEFGGLGLDKVTSMLVAESQAVDGSWATTFGAKTVARLSEDGTHYLVNGGKMWITNGGFADVYVVFLKVDGQRF